MIALAIICGVFFLILLFQYLLAKDEEVERKRKENRTESEAAIEEEEEIEWKELSPAERQHRLYRELGLADETPEEKRKRKDRERRRKEAKKRRKEAKKAEKAKKLAAARCTVAEELMTMM